MDPRPLPDSSEGAGRTTGEAREVDVRLLVLLLELRSITLSAAAIELVHRDARKPTPFSSASHQLSVIISETG
jgi:hypothetical protein